MFICTNPKHEWFTYNTKWLDQKVCIYTCTTCKKVYIKDNLTGRIYEADTKIMIREKTK